MASKFPTTKATAIPSAVSDYVHPEYLYWHDQWQNIRDCMLGQHEIKSQTTRYLPKLSGQDPEEYDAYLERGTFFNMVSRTVQGLTGSIFRREPTVENLPKKYDAHMKRITKENQSIYTFAKQVTQEVIAMGRYGVLLDMAEAGGVPYLAGYVAENILDWETKIIDGRSEISRVLLREVSMADRKTGVTIASDRYIATYRELKLDDDGVYRQYVYRGVDGGQADLSKEASETITPVNRGATFDRIPFQFFGPFSNATGIEKSPVLDIALMNLSHYLSYAQLEHGRFYTALPIYYVQTETGEEGGDYYVGPNRVWEVGASQKPGIVEYHGHGLSFLERALDQKQQQVSDLGGRMLGVRGTAVAESDNLVKLKEKNEQSLLLNVSIVVDDGLTNLVKGFVEWLDGDGADIRVELNQDFLFDDLKAREFRAIHQMYVDGLLSIDIFFEIMQKADIIPDKLTVEDFKKQLDDPEQFPNQANMLARMKGYPDANHQFTAEVTMPQEEAIAAQNLKAQEKIAKEAAKKTTEKGTKNVETK